MKIIGIIPARVGSTRLPRKMLKLIGNKTVIQRTYEQAIKSMSLSDLIVATDSNEIYNHVKDFGGNVCMTNTDHASGTDRCFEALDLQLKAYDYVINIQGDEPFIEATQINLLVDALDCQTEIATLIKKIKTSEQLTNQSVVKTVINVAGEALYFTRCQIPTDYEHIGLYAYRSDILKKIVSLSESKLEKLESLEQMRWLDNGFTIDVVETFQSSFSINTQEDLDKANEMVKNGRIQ